MPSISNNTITLTSSDDGLRVTLMDRRRGQTWELATDAWGFDEKDPAGRWTYSALTPFGPGTARQISAGALEIAYPVPGGQAAYTWTLIADGVEVCLNVQSDAVKRISHPGGFRPAGGRMEMLIPSNQGVLARDAGPDHNQRCPIGGGMMLSMYGYLGPKGALLAAQEDIRDNFILYGRAQGAGYALFELERCPVDGWYERRMRFLTADRGITALCKCYRRRLIERGDFVGWEEKIRRKPIVEKLFGALIAFIGYNQAHETDYVQGARELRARGFDTVFYYPARFNSMNLNFQMGGGGPLWLSDEQIRAMQEAGGIIAPWAWTYEVLDDGTEKTRGVMRHDPDGKPVAHWQIGDQVWMKACTPYQIEFIRRQYEGPMQAMGWTHYDVNSTRGGEVCFNARHEKHGNRPLSARADQMFIAELLGAGVNGNRVVSSEGFGDFCAKYYDLGSNKYAPAWGEAPYIPIPMTMLVLHDSTIHNYWEIDTYNEVPSTRIKKSAVAPRGSGWPAKKAAMDALYGCPPLVFPFGRQYGYVEGGKNFETYSYEVHLTDAEVRLALDVALPLTRLHRKVGKLELLSFEFVTDDYAVQTTEFADGTRIVANISDADKDTPTFGHLPANSWREV